MYELRLFRLLNVRLPYENVVFELELIEEVLYSLKISQWVSSVSLKNLLIDFPITIETTYTDS